LMNRREERSRREEQRLKRQQKQWAEDLTWMMADVRGRRVIANIMQRGGYGRDVFTGNSQGNYLQGRQSLATEFVHEIRMIAFNDFQRMEREAANAQRIAQQVDNLPDDTTE
jgi:hypothetical protein